MTNSVRKVALLPAALALAVPAFVAPAHAQGVLHRHPKATGVVAGLAAHHLAKKAARHGSHGLAARHPVATGVAAGLAAHHLAKKH